MRTIDSGNTLASNSDLIRMPSKFSRKLKDQLNPVRELLEGLKGCLTLKDCENDIGNAQVAVADLENFFETEDDNLRGFTRDLNYMSEVLNELEAQGIEEKEGKLRERTHFSFDDPPPQDMDES
jgi:hypothetical protein